MATLILQAQGGVGRIPAAAVDPLQAADDQDHVEARRDQSGAARHEGHTHPDAGPDGQQRGGYQGETQLNLQGSPSGRGRHLS